MAIHKAQLPPGHPYPPRPRPPSTFPPPMPPPPAVQPPPLHPHWQPGLLVASQQPSPHYQNNHADVQAAYEATLTAPGCLTSRRSASRNTTTSTRLSSASKSRLRRQSIAARLDPRDRAVTSHTTLLLRHRRSYRQAPRAAHDSRRRPSRLSLYRPVPSSPATASGGGGGGATLTRITPTYT